MKTAVEQLSAMHSVTRPTAAQQREPLAALGVPSLVEALGHDLDRAVAAWATAEREWIAACEHMHAVRRDQELRDGALDACNRAAANAECARRVKDACGAAHDRAWRALEGK